VFGPVVWRGSGSRGSATTLTRRSSQECAGCIHCGAGNYTIKPCDIDGHAVCGVCTLCNFDTQYQTRDCEGSLNALCEPLAECSEQEFVLVNETRTSNRECRRISTCAAGQSISRASTRFEDLDCTNCPAGTTDHDSDPASGCQECPAGTYVPPGSKGPCELFACQAGFTDLDSEASSECVPCDGIAEFSPLPGRSGACLAMRQCEPGTGVVAATPGSPSSDRNCSECPMGFFTRESNSACSSWTACDIFFMESQTPTSSSNRFCRSCVAGESFLPGSETTAQACVACSAGSYCPVGTLGATQQHRCDPGSVDADSNPATECEPCVQNLTYAKNRGQTACTNATVCGPGLLEDVAPTLESDRTCRPDPNAQGSSSKGSAGGSTAIIAAAAVVGLVVVAAVVLILLRRQGRNSNPRKATEARHTVAFENPM
jgi:hypothetical protein